jgi:DNA-binding LacI/PurR family transcriptional regulator
MISPIDRVRIAAQIVADPRTVLRVYQGKGSEHTRRRVTEAAKTLGLPPPPPPADSTQRAA